MTDKLDRDPFIFTGVEATPDDVLDMLVDPDSPITPAVIPLLPPEQQPDPDRVAEVLGTVEG